MQQRQLRLGDILDDYCPRERRVTNHAVVAMVGADVKQTRCTTCEAEHEYKHAKVPRHRKKTDTTAALAQGGASGPKRVMHDIAHEAEAEGTDVPSNGGEKVVIDAAEEPRPEAQLSAGDEPLPSSEESEAEDEIDTEEGPVHRPLIRATLPRPDGQPPPTRPAPEFTIRQPAGRPGRFRPRHHRGQLPFPGNRSGNMSGGGGMSRPGGRPQMSRSGKRLGPGRKRSK